VAELRSAKERLQRGVEELESRVQELLRALEESQCAGKRQAAPFSRRSPKAHPDKPGRKAGTNYGRRDRKQIGEQGLVIARGQLEARLDRIQNRNYRAAANQRLANHLRTERNAMFTFSLLPGIGGDKISRRASHSSHGGNPQGLGRQSHRAGRTHAKRIGQHFANLPSAASARPAFLEQLLHMPKAQHLELTPPHTR
jgi:hypothetical protein